MAEQETKKSTWIVAILGLAGLFLLLGLCIFWGSEINKGAPGSSSSSSSSASDAKKNELEKKLGSVYALTACEEYGKKNYRDFDIHKILGMVAEEAVDSDTWFFEYEVSADGYDGKHMKCFVTGTSDSPKVTNFSVY